MKKKKPIINCHTHIFTEKNIPPWIAKTFIPWPFYLLTHVPTIFWFMKLYKKIRYSGILKKIIEVFNYRKSIIIAFKSYLITSAIYNLLYFLFFINGAYYLILGLNTYIFKASKFPDLYNSIISFLKKYYLIYDGLSLYMQIALIAILFYLFPAFIKIIWLVLKFIFSPLKYIPNKKSLEFMKRYLSIAEFAKYTSQKKIYDRLYKMYEPDSKFIVLPMDMEYMDAGTPRQRYIDQIYELKSYIDKNLKNTENLLPFIFVDPQRIRKDNMIKEKNLSFFKWHWDESEKKVIMDDCLLKQFLEKKPENNQDTCFVEGTFKGIKIYPALGYYPFDEDLLPLWAYCCQHNIPITTHCIKGTIFYRGLLKNAWKSHPVFEEENGIKLNISQSSNYDQQINFTHPLNYLVLLEPKLLDIFLHGCSKETQEIFGYDTTTKKSVRNLSNLKINFAHYGGEDQWERYSGLDRNEEAQEIIETPGYGIRFLEEQNPKNPGGIREERPYKPASLWKNESDWYSIISSMMLQYRNVYADISYIIHAEKIRALLYTTLDNPGLSRKVLFGTDFFVVRNHSSEKELYAETMAFLGKKKMDLISRKNPDRFISK